VANQITETKFYEQITKMPRAKNTPDGMVIKEAVKAPEALFMVHCHKPFGHQTVAALSH
jgi:hypothetical protein